MEAGDLGNTREPGKTGDTINSRGHMGHQGTPDMHTGDRKDTGDTREKGDKGDTRGHMGHR